MKSKMWWLPLGSAVVAVSVIASGCTSSKSSTAPQNLSDNHAAQLAADGKTKDAADEYARIGELLLMPEGFQYADKEFAKALALDPANAKANLYKAVTEPAMTAQGFVTRMERLVTADSDVKALEQLRENIKALKMPEVNTFANDLPGGEKPFETYHDVQRFAREKLLPSILASIDKLNKIDATNPIQLNFTPSRVLTDPVRREETYSYNSSDCSYDPTHGYNCTSYNYSGGYSDPKLPNVYFVDKHDLKIIKSSMMALADHIRLATAFSMQDSEFVLRRLKAVDAIRKQSGLPGVSARDVTEILRNYSAFLTLESDQQLAPIAASESEAMKNTIDLANMRAELCDGHNRTADNSLIRPICIEASVVDSLKLGVDLLAGPKVVNVGSDEDGNSINVMIDLNAILKNPPKDIKALLPTAFDANGNPVQYPDPTMGGLFPNGDIINKLKLVGSSSNMDSALHGVHDVIHGVKEHI